MRKRPNEYPERGFNYLSKTYLYREQMRITVFRKTNTSIIWEARIQDIKYGIDYGVVVKYWRGLRRIPVELAAFRVADDLIANPGFGNNFFKPESDDLSLSQVVLQV